MSDTLPPDPKTFLQRSGVRTLIVLFGAQAIDALVLYLTGLSAPWAPYVAAAVTALWNVYKNPSAPVAPPPAVVVRPPNG